MTRVIHSVIRVVRAHQRERSQATAINPRSMPRWAPCSWDCLARHADIQMQPMYGTIVESSIVFSGLRDSHGHGRKLAKLRRRQRRKDYTEPCTGRADGKGRGQRADSVSVGRAVNARLEWTCPRLV